MKEKEGIRKFLGVLNSKPVIGALIFIMLSLVTVFAGDIVVKDGSLTAGDRIYDKTGFVTPVGSINAYGGSIAPTGWLLCDGKNYSRTDYADLYAIIGTNYGSNSGNDFYVPSLNSSNYINSSSNSSGFGSSLDNGLFGVWEFNENTGTNAAESTKGLFNGTLNSVNWTNGIQGSGVGDRVVFTADNAFDQIFANTTKSATISFWVNLSSSDESDHVILGRGQDNQGSTFFAIWYNYGGRVDVWRKQGSDGTSSRISWAGVINTTDIGSRSHYINFVVTLGGRSNNQIHLYKNGINQSVPTTLNDALTTDLSISGKPMQIGVGATTGGSDMNHITIDELYIWNRTLTENEINDLYNSGSGKTYSSEGSSYSYVPYLNYIIKT